MPKKGSRRKKEKKPVKQVTEEESEKEDEPNDDTTIFSLDSLLEEREKEKNEIVKFDSPKKAESDDDDSVVEITDMKLKPLLERDGSVFTFNDSSFPIRLLTFLDVKDTCGMHLTPRLSDLQWRMVKIQPDFVQPSQTLLFSLVQELIVTSNKEIGECLLNYVQCFPRESIEFTAWKDYLKESIVSAQAVAEYVIALARYKIFTSVSKAEDKKRNVSVMLTFMAAILSQQSNTTRAFNMIIENLTDYLSAPLGLNDRDFEYIITSVLELAHDQPFTNVSFLVSLFPMNENGALIIGPIAANSALTLLNSKKEGLEGLCEDISLLKNLCISKNDDDIIAASAVLAFSERAIVSAIKFKLITIDQLNKFNDGLQFNMVNPTGQQTFMVRIREQLHITRSQIDLYKEMLV